MKHLREKSTRTNQTPWKWKKWNVKRWLFVCARMKRAAQRVKTVGQKPHHAKKGKAAQGRRVVRLWVAAERPAAPAEEPDVEVAFPTRDGVLAS